ncbi:hypothetical protein JCGZ_23232 [Jatropha curcas]|uniref:Uncharacterized protein n=1 Tax=Jatropha curcas TaxID=180498 RepID=A0A067JV26_JATCU|nr:uncharacterized protein LOC105647434 [Jatropha curcas]XP_012088911.1 uncharacterized protein LOC105647434 [Jatropha curcas]XP_012088913.1 uncharacterized protein LOC105647434 [Jatropha curcas]KDP23399.1 hypothetical protein JCGZ_23232 [Jatropha curcas]
MDHLGIRSNSLVDLEIGGSSSANDEVRGLGSSGQKPKTDRLKSGSLSSARKMRSDDEISLSEGELSSSGNLEILVGERGEKAKTSVENGTVKDKRKKRSAKPPLPPRGPSLDAADRKLLREMSELARLRRTRTQHIKALKKKRAEKASSPSSNIFPMVVTIVFFGVIIFQGLLGSRV